MKDLLAWLREEPRRLWRGVLALRMVFGNHFTLGLLLTFGLLLWAIQRHHGGITFAMCLVCVLLAIRAHDLGDLEEEPSEFNTYWRQHQQERAELQRIREQAVAHEASQGAAHDFNSLETDRAEVLGRRAGRDV
ncbi:MAG: hypothetical protein HOQ02_10355 [Lysobacter sp.]|nr:hypothetical protein [Lysobacter sp.]